MVSVGRQLKGKNLPGMDDRQCVGRDTCVSVFTRAGRPQNGVPHLSLNLRKVGLHERKSYCGFCAPLEGELCCCCCRAFCCKYASFCNCSGVSTALIFGDAVSRI